MTDKITTIEMEEALARYFNPRLNIIVPNVSWGMDIHECDLLVLRKSGHLVEIEIKVSKADLKKDGGKPHQHIDNRIREFWFAIPDYLQDSIQCIPERAGILVLSKNHDWGTYINCRVLREAKINSKAEKLCKDEVLAIARLGTMRIWSLKRKIIEMKRTKAKKPVKQNKNQLNLAI